MKPRPLADRLRANGIASRDLGGPLLALFVLACACDGPHKVAASAPLPAQSLAQSPGPTAERPTPPPESGHNKGTRDRTTAPPAPLSDKGVFPQFNEQVKTKCPSWLSLGPLLQVAFPGSNRTWLAADGVIVCESAQGHPGVESAVIAKSALRSQDHDGDQIPDAIDILRGAKKAALNGAAYKNNYLPLAFPGGDVPSTEGVCTDVIVRSLRNTGVDLQELLFKDIAARPHAYPMVKKRDPHIDHRRVRTLLPYFESKYKKLPTAHNDSGFPYLPGDVVFMDTLGDSEPEHLGIISDELGASGHPLVINNWTVGTTTKEMDLLGRIPVTHRFRIAGPLSLTHAHRGLEGVLARQQLSVPGETKQVLLMTSPLWGSTGGTLTRWNLEKGGPAVLVGDAVPVRLGQGGLATGLGLHGASFRAPGAKKEGDKKAPAGLFTLGTSFGTARKAPFEGSLWPYRQTGPRDYWIDDPKSPNYNEWITLQPGETLAWSAEHLPMYSLGLVVNHNTGAPQPGAGSAIFLHPWKSPSTPTVGCTALNDKELKVILSWLDPKKSPVLVQVADRVY